LIETILGDVCYSKLYVYTTTELAIANGLSPPGPKLVAVVAIGTGGDVRHHRRLVTRTGGDDVADHHRRLVTRAGGDDGHHRRLVLPTGGDESVQYKTPTPSSSHQSSSPTRRPHLSLPLLRPDFAKILKKPCHS